MRHVDFAVRTATERFAFEIDGLVWHHWQGITIAKFEDETGRRGGEKTRHSEVPGGQQR